MSAIMHVPSPIMHVTMVNTIYITLHLNNTLLQRQYEYIDETKLVLTVKGCS